MVYFKPILVTKEGKYYRLISGERRLRACRHLKKKSIPCVIKSVSPEKVQALSLIENIQREQLDPIEEALAYRSILDSHSLTQDKLAEQVGKNRSTIANKVRLLNLPLNAQTYIADGKLTEGQARPLLGIRDEIKCAQMIEKIRRENLNARQIEELVKKVNEPQVIRKKTSKKSKQPGEIKALENKIEQRLKTRVKLKHDAKKNKGELIIDYF